MRTSEMIRPRLRLVGGVCAGFSDHTGVPVAVVRTVTMLLTVCGGAGALLYAWLWVTTPAEGATPEKGRAALTRPGTHSPGSTYQVSPSQASHIPASQTPASSWAQDASAADAVRRKPVTELLLGVALLAAAAAVIASRLGVDIPLAVVIPGIVVLAGAGLAWRQFADLRTGSSADPSALLVRALGALVLVALGILLFFVTTDTPNVWTVIVAAVSVLLGVAIVTAPWLVRLSRDLAEQRSAAERESERAEIAAHLHDSVLQTLALIQQKAGPHSDAARLARAQESELREWLFLDRRQPAVDLPSELRRMAGVIEQDFPVRFTVVAAGSVDGCDTAAIGALVAAAREAMLNAARHAGGEVSVYLEGTPTGLELIVTDRGPGFVLDTIPADRMGVRESIIGRMARVQGTATIGAGPGRRGTSVTLTLAKDQTGTHGNP